MSNPGAILIGAVIIAAALAVIFRWEVTPATKGVVRLDHWTGEVTECLEPVTPQGAKSVRYDCETK